MSFFRPFRFPFSPSPKKKTFLFFSFFLLFFLLEGISFAHMTTMGHIIILVTPEKKTIDLLSVISIQDIGTFLKIDTDKNGRIEYFEFEQAESRIGAYLGEHLKVSNNGLLCQVVVQRFVKNPAIIKRIAKFVDRRRLYFLQKVRCQKPLENVAIENTILFEDFGGYRHYGRIQVGQRRAYTVFSRLYPVYTIHLKHSAAFLAQRAKNKLLKEQKNSTTKKADELLVPMSKVALRYIWEGIVHITDVRFSLDHILFLLSLLLLVSDLKKLIFVLTAFTIGHSVTLALSAFQVMSVPSRITETLIAFSIAYVALENIIRYKNPPQHRYLLTFLFGLVHGVGFSYILKDLLKLKTNALVPALFSFNVGVELGQILIVFMLYPLLLSVMKRDFYGKIVRNLSGMIFLIALYWIIVRALG